MKRIKTTHTTLRKEVPTTLTNEEARIFLATGKLPDQVQVKKKNKYNAVRKIYKGKSYDSTAEADYHAHLDLIAEAECITEIETQYKIPLIFGQSHITNYFIDFKLNRDGVLEFHEVKGKETALWKIKYMMAKVWMEKAHPEAVLVLVKKVNGKFSEVERYKVK